MLGVVHGQIKPVEASQGEGHQGIHLISVRHVRMMVGRLASRAKVETAADRMEMLMPAVAAGGISERYPVGSRRWSEYALTAVDGSGSESGRGKPGPVAAACLEAAEIRPREVDGGWLPRPLRGH